MCKKLFGTALSFNDCSCGIYNGRFIYTSPPGVESTDICDVAWHLVTSQFGFS